MGLKSQIPKGQFWSPGKAIPTLSELTCIKAKQNTLADIHTMYTHRYACSVTIKLHL